MPSDYISNNFSDFDRIARDFANPSSGTFQLATYPTIFPAADNDLRFGDWNLYLTTRYGISENKADAVLVKNSPDKVTIYTRNHISRNNPSESATTHYPLEQAIVLHSNGNIELHYATDFPFAEMMVDTDSYEDTRDVLGLRFYSGIMIPTGITGGAAIPLINNIETNGNKSYLFTAATLNNLPAESFPNDGSNLVAAAPVLMEDTNIETADLPYTQFASTDSASITLAANLAASQDYIWAARQVATYTEGDYSNQEASQWSDSSQFSVEATEDDDDGFLGLGSINPFLIFGLLFLVFIRKQK